MDPIAALMWMYLPVAGWCGLAGALGAPWLLVDGVRNVWRFWRPAWFSVGLLLALHAADAWSTAKALDLGGSEMNPLAAAMFVAWGIPWTALLAVPVVIAPAVCLLVEPRTADEARFRWWATAGVVAMAAFKLLAVLNNLGVIDVLRS